MDKPHYKHLEKPHYKTEDPHYKPPLIHHPDKNHHEYYVYDMAKIPECAYTNKHYYNLTFCLQDDYYPM